MLLFKGVESIRFVLRELDFLVETDLYKGFHSRIVLNNRSKGFTQRRNELYPVPETLGSKL